MFWHVPYWFAGQPGSSVGAESNTGNDIVHVLLDTEQASAVLGQDTYTVHRVIGQYHLMGDEDPVVHHYVHHRIYAAQSDATSLALRTIVTADDADTSFMWHEVTPWSTPLDGDIWGSWQVPGNGNPSPAQHPRQGHFDVSVKRTVKEGESLIFHTQFVPTPLVDDTFWMHMWVRLLVSKKT